VHFGSLTGAPMSSFSLKLHHRVRFYGHSGYRERCPGQIAHGCFPEEMEHLMLNDCINRLMIPAVVGAHFGDAADQKRSGGSQRCLARR
jgi:hypothetical protein